MGLSTTGELFLLGRASSGLTFEIDVKLDKHIELDLRRLVTIGGGLSWVGFVVDFLGEGLSNILCLEHLVAEHPESLQLSASDLACILDCAQSSDDCVAFVFFLHEFC